jgi:hypothetical protein
MLTRQGDAQPALSKNSARPKPSKQLSKQNHCHGRCAQVPVEVWSAVADLIALSEDLGLDGGSRLILAKRVAPIMAKEGWRFCTCYRSENTPEHRTVYGLLSTVHANFVADHLALASAAAYLTAAAGSR